MKTKLFLSTAIVVMLTGCENFEGLDFGFGQTANENDVQTEVVPEADAPGGYANESRGGGGEGPGGGGSEGGSWN